MRKLSNLYNLMSILQNENLQKKNAQLFMQLDEGTLGENFLEKNVLQLND